MFNLLGPNVLTATSLFSFALIFRIIFDFLTIVHILPSDITVSGYDSQADVYWRMDTRCICSSADPYDITRLGIKRHQLGIKRHQLGNAGNLYARL